MQNRKPLKTRRMLVRRAIRGLMTGRFMPLRLREFMTWYATAWIIAVLAFVLAVYASLAGARIRVATAAFTWRSLWHGSAAVDVHVMLFWLGLFAWAFLLAMRLLADDLKRDEQFEQTYLAASNAPPAHFTNTYAKRFSAIAEMLAGTAGEPALERKLELENRIREVLKLLAQMAWEFAGQREDISYGANIMLVANPPFAQSLIDVLVFFDKDRYDSPQRLAAAINASARQLLYLPSELLVANLEGREHRDIPLIALHVPVKDQDSSHRSYAVPGAPFALVTGTNSVFRDTHQLAEECKHFDLYVQESIRQYFTVGAGKSVRSFASWRIGSKTDPVGVLNIDCDEKDVLGRVPLFYVRFHSYMVPILHILAPIVAEYAVLRERAATEGLNSFSG